MVQHWQPSAQSQAQSVHSSHCPPEQQPAFRFEGRVASAIVAMTTFDAASRAASPDVPDDLSPQADTADVFVQQDDDCAATASSAPAQQGQAQSSQVQGPPSQH